MIVEILNEGHDVALFLPTVGFVRLSAQEAYELHQRLSAVLPQLVQPFSPIQHD